MLAREAESEAPIEGSWFLVGYEGQVVLRITRSLRVGEDAAGDLVLFPTRLEELVEITSIGEQLRFRSLSDEMILSMEGRLERSFRISPPSSALLELPHCTLPLTRDLNSRAREPGAIHLKLICRAGSVAEGLSESTSEVTATRFAGMPNPDSSFADMSVPDMSVPDMSVPDMSVPDMSVPDMSVPDMSVPDMSVPDMSVPDMPFPDIPVPEDSDLSDPWTFDDAVPPDMPLLFYGVGSEPTTGSIRRDGGRVHLLIITLATLIVCLLPVNVMEQAGQTVANLAEASVAPTTAAGVETDLPALPPQPEAVNTELFESVVALIRSFDRPDETTIEFALQMVQRTLAVDPEHRGALELREYLTSLSRDPAGESGAREQVTVLGSLEDQTPGEPAVQAGERAAAAGERAAAAGVQAQPETPRSPTGADRLLAIRLDEAQEMLEAGSVIAPTGRNAVTVLRQVLSDDPDNARALGLIQKCADALVAEAKTARAAGDEYNARNLIEEVRAFHPNHPKANRLWQTLTES